MAGVEKKLPGDPYSKLIRARFWIVGGEGDGYLGIGRIKLLENIQRYGSINRAAKEMNMSYKKAWKLVEDMNQLACQPLVLSEKGGRQGGGTQVTELGEAYIRYFRDLEDRLSKFLVEESVKLKDLLVH
ncbi:LysR family transcriptional regulator [Thiomicrospira microaerophila]|uniref:winged helix-turn-helix domain-containing protein n=1 Tax=Thiomicrospira microaerophila TaxID=406020 RepID=UPI00200EA7E2|nr:LysR family transcriptional regulator [Thiomicrospira microaerophila]UQB42917.1 LysR family transcriptional regulator [Thiomicrospira microaerophila]